MTVQTFSSTPPIRIAHLVSNFKWTERAEPAADLAKAQQALGHDVTFLCGKNRRIPENSIEYQAAKKGLQPLTLDFPKHFRFTSAHADIRRLRRLIAERHLQVLHCHLPNAHLLAARAVHRMPTPPLIIRSSYGPDGPWPTWRLRRLCLPHTNGFVTVSEKAAARTRRMYNLAPAQVLVTEPGIDLQRFGAQNVQRNRAAFGLTEQDQVLGMVTAIGPRRRLDLILEAVAQLSSRYPRLKCMIVGRGKIERCIDEPARALGIRDRIVLPGYCRGKKLVEAYKTMDLFVYPVPGTDPSARAVREAMAAGTAILAGNTGFLPDLLEHGSCGRLANLNPDAFAHEIVDLLDHPETRLALANDGFLAAQRRLDPLAGAQRMTDWYSQLRTLESPAT